MLEQISGVTEDTTELKLNVPTITESNDTESVVETAEIKNHEAKIADGTDEGSVVQTAEITIHVATIMEVNDADSNNTKALDLTPNVHNSNQVLEENGLLEDFKCDPVEIEGEKSVEAAEVGDAINWAPTPVAFAADSMVPVTQAPRVPTMTPTRMHADMGLAQSFLGDNAYAKTVFGFLQSSSSSSSTSTSDSSFTPGRSLVQILKKNGGFTEFAEKLNGRVAQFVFPLSLAQTGKSNLIEQVLDHPLQVRVCLCGRLLQ